MHIYVHICLYIQNRHIYVCTHVPSPKHLSPLAQRPSRFRVYLTPQKIYQHSLSSSCQVLTNAFVAVLGNHSAYFVGGVRCGKKILVVLGQMFYLILGFRWGSGSRFRTLGLGLSGLGFRLTKVNGNTYSGPITTVPDLVADDTSISWTPSGRKKKHQMSSTWTPTLEGLGV